MSVLDVPREWSRLTRGILPLVVFSCLLLYNPPVFAAQNQGSALTTSPISIDIVAFPGTSVTTDLKVQNSSSKSEIINVQLEKFSVSGTSGQAAIYSPTATDPSASWVHFSQTSFVAQPGVWNTVGMTIDLPAGASLGYYYAVLFVPVVGVTPSPTYSATVKGANAILVLLDTHSKNEQRELVIKSFASQKLVYEYLPATFSLDVANTGNIHLIPKGDVYISRTKNGKPLATMDINEGQGNVLPKSIRQFQVQWSNGFPVFETKRVNGQIAVNNHGQPEQQLIWNFSSPLSWFRFGRYYAHLVLVYNNGTRDIPVDSYVSFYVIPYKLIASVIFIPIALVIAWRLARKRLRAIWNEALAKENKTK